MVVNVTVIVENSILFLLSLLPITKLLEMIKSYFDLQDITANEEIVPVKFVVPSFNIGKDIIARSSDGESTSSEISTGSTARLPLWAAAPLRKEGYVAVHVPPKYTVVTFREFKTDPLAPSLRHKSPTYYDTGLTICRLIGNTTAGGHMSREGNRLAAQLHRLYQLRYLKIILSGAKKGFDLSDVKEKLTDSERYLLESYLSNRDREQTWYSNAI
ncbi:GINS complex subunit 3 [Angomonas deanei]|uniref:GINS complex protein, putative n=1 Tax=Angomonas deanei TaxID=59799 RepID=A0A7G2C7E2_9TRYP|nr:GINS complex subunit 3 [Angomonas deanei]CAD2215666.1 GINS complex protein, putative [Angomonas deanei]|eukprot:EPY42554.1 GINS complex subunit 3 [Angomonas deanei]